MLNKKGILAYLVVTIVLSLAVEAIALGGPRVSVVAYLALLVPAAGAWIARRIAPDEEPAAMKIRDIPRLSGIRIALVIPLVAICIYLITTMTGVTRPDWRITETLAQIPSPQQLELPPAFGPLWPVIFLPLIFALNLVLGPTLFALCLLANEYGWRGYLLPRLMPLGKWKAYLLTGALWWLAFGPYAVCRWEESRALFGALLFVQTLVLAVLLARVSQASRHIGLTALTCGVYVCQMTTAWEPLFPHAKTALPWGGAYGVVAIVIWAGVAAFPAVFLGRLGKVASD